MPSASKTLGFELLSVDPEAGTVEVAFTAKDSFPNPVGVIQGGFLAAMLDETLGPALVAALGPDRFAPSADLHIQYLRSAKPGRLVDRGRVLKKGRGIAFMSGELVDKSGAVLTMAVATASIRRLRS